MDNKNKKIESAVNSFLDQKDLYNSEECKDEQCVIKNDKSIQERINKKIITEDGRQLLT